MLHKPVLLVKYGLRVDHGVGCEDHLGCFGPLAETHFV
jgi:hypothetical protein